MTIVVSVVYFDTEGNCISDPVSLQLPNIQDAHFPHGSNFRHTKSHLLAMQVC